MGKYKEIIEKIQKQEMLLPPDDIVQKVMAGAKKAEESLVYKLYRLLFQRRQLSPDAAGVLSGKIVSPIQCSFLLSVVGLFYLLMGLFILAGLKDVLAGANIHFWLRLQPYLAAGSGVVILLMAFVIQKNPRKIVTAKYVIMAHTTLVVINVVILEYILIFPAALVLALALAALAVISGMLLVSYLHNFSKTGSIDTGRQIAQNV